MTIWTGAAAFCCLMVMTCLAADNITPVGFTSIQKCREYQQEHEGIAQNIKTSPRINVPTPDPDRIIFARSVGPKQEATKFPYAAAIYDQTGSARCSGTLISDRFILSAAHCLTKKQSRMTYVVLGVEEIDPLAQNFLNISRNIPHPQYNTNGNQYYSDIGLIQLEEPVTFSKKVRPACLSTHHYSDDDDWFMVTWVVELETTGTRKQQKFAVTSDNCQQNYQNYDNVAYGIIDHLQICVEEHTNAGIWHQPISIVVSNKGASGYTVVGTPSFGVRATNSGQVYTRVAGYIKWIESIVWPDLPILGCSKFNFQLNN